MQAQRCHQLLVFSLAIVAGIATVSCRQEPKSAAPADVTEIRGERIAPAPAIANGIAADVKPNAVASSTPATQPVPTVAGSAVPAEPNESVTPPTAAGEPYTLGFDKLSAFTYEMPPDLLDTNQPAVSKPSDQIPAAVRAFDKKDVALKGFMLPLKVEAGLVTELLILRDQSMCCYGAVPKINEWVSVKMAGKGVKPVMDQAVTLIGKLHVGEVRENGYLVGIYQMEGEKIANPPGL